MAGCVDDKGNYDYEAAGDITPIITTGIEPSYTAIMLNQLVIEPQIEGSDEDYEFYWVTYPSGVTTIGKRDTIGTERKLDYTVALAPGSHKVIFQVKDKETGVSAFQSTIVGVTGQFGTGYFVTKNVGGRTDIDFINAEGTVSTNVLQTINGTDLPGKPLKITMTDRYSYPDADGVRINWVNTIVVSTDEAAAIYNGSDLKTLFDWEHMFMESPAVSKPQGVWGHGSGFMLLNDGKIHATNAYNQSPGTFGYAYPEEGLKLSPMACAATSNMMFFDENSGALVGYSGGTDRYAYKTPFAGYEQHHYTNQELIWMGTQHNYNSSASRAFALLRSKDDGKIRLVDAAAGSFNTYRALVYYGSYEVPAGFTVGDGTIFCCKGGNGNSAIYYSMGDNNVSYYNYNNQTQKLNALSIPADEKIVFIKHKYDGLCNGIMLKPHALNDADLTDWNSFLVLSTKGDNWTLRVYDMVGATPDIEATPKATYTGTGEAVSVMPRDQHTIRTW